jgi:allantoinase
VPVEALVRMLTRNVARRFGVPGKGELVVGADADVVVVDLAKGEGLKSEDLAYRHRVSPYVGLPVHGMVRRTMVRGVTVFAEGVVRGGRGRFVRRRG